MADFEVIIINGQETVQFLEALDQALTNRRKELFRSLGEDVVSRVRTRIITRDGGRWAPASKWSRAKSGFNYPTLLGAEKFVRFTATAAGLKVVGHSGKWTLTQHHEGFRNKLDDPSEPHDDHGRVVLKIKDGAPLNLYQEFRRQRNGTVKQVASVFAFKPVREGKTPARKIWDEAGEVVEKSEPIVSRWLAKVVADAGGSLVRG